MHRRVHHLRFTCAREEHARHGRVLLEDALRTASFGDEARLVLVRRLEVGPLPLRASATAWSRRLETSYERLRRVAVSADAPGAARADAVFFPNTCEPWVRLIVRTIAGEPCTDWFWGPALPGWTARHSAADTLRLAFRALATEGGLRATLMLARRLHSLPPLLQALQPGDLAGVQAELTAGATPSRPAGEARSFAVTPGDRPHDRAGLLDPAEAAAAASWPADDVRLRWLATAQLTRQANAGFGDPPGPSAVDALLRHWAELGLRRGSEDLVNQPAAVTSSRPSGPAKEAQPPPAPDRGLTLAGGLFFTLPLLERAGLPAFMPTLPPDQRAAYPRQVLGLMLCHALGDQRRADFSPPRHAGAGPVSDGSDAARQNDGCLRGRKRADARLASDAVGVAFTDLPAPPAGLGRWLIRANRDALRLTGLNLRQIVRRPARVSWSPTHVDVFFRPGEADIRVRRAGLDIDPGWVPWLNRVVHYHYTSDD